MLAAVDYYLDDAKEIVIVITEGGDVLTQPLINKLRGRYLPNKALAVIQEGDAEAVKLIPIAENKNASGGRSAAYVCSGGGCNTPTTNADELLHFL